MTWNARRLSRCLKDLRHFLEEVGGSICGGSEVGERWVKTGPAREMPISRSH